MLSVTWLQILRVEWVGADLSTHPAPSVTDTERLMLMPALISGRAVIAYAAQLQRLIAHHLHRDVICDYCWRLFAATGTTPVICALGHSVFMQITLRCTLHHHGDIGPFSSGKTCTERVLRVDQHLVESAARV